MLSLVLNVAPEFVRPNPSDNALPNQAPNLIVSAELAEYN